MKKLLVAALVVTAGLVSVGVWLYRDTPPAESTGFPLSRLLNEAGQGFAQVEPGWAFVFPRDHGAHPWFHMETWHFTGSLTSERGRRFGFQLSFLRLGLSPEPPRRASAWAAHQAYLAQLTVSDVQAGRFYTFERMARAALGLAGDSQAPLRVWVENWEIEVPDTAAEHVFQLRAATDEVRLDLDLVGVKPVITEVDPLTADERSSAYHGYWIPRLQARGILERDGEVYAVTGLAWLDRTWGTMQVSQGQLALNRFLLQLNDGRDVLLVQIGRRDGSAEPITTGVLVTRDGSLRRLKRDDLSLETVEHWRSPRAGVRYPARWQLHLPAEDLTLHILPLMEEQELHLPVRYWGGLVEVRGWKVQGTGRAELMGYAPSDRTFWSRSLEVTGVSNQRGR